MPKRQDKGGVKASRAGPERPPGGLRGWSYDPFGPRWTPVPALELASAPYEQICALTVTEAGSIVSRGTGWLCRDGVIATAAHVLERGDTCEVRWANSPDVFATHRFALHPDYVPQSKGSDVDLARIWDVPTPSKALVLADDPPAQVMAAGFQQGALVRHSGPATPVPPYLAHAADTDEGHSGCPILAGDRVVALHLGTTDRTGRFLKEAEARRLHTRNNCAILLTSPSARFLYD